MTKRKLALLAAVVVLGGVYAVLSLLARPETIRTLVMEEKPDSITIEKQDGTSLRILKNGDAWVVGDQRYPADTAAVDALVAAAEKIKVLDTVSSGDDADRYGLGADGGILVSVQKGETVLRRLDVGKTASTSQQSYLRLDGGTDILLVSGDLNRSFGKSLDDLRDREVLSFAPSDLKAVGVAGKDTYQLAKSGSPEIWKVSAPRADIDLKVDAEKMDAWVSSLSSLRAEGFAPESERMEGTSQDIPFGELALDFGSRTAKVTIHRQIADGKYLCSTTENPYLFYLSEYSVARVLKPRDELMAE